MLLIYSSIRSLIICKLKDSTMFGNHFRILNARMVQSVESVCVLSCNTICLLLIVFSIIKNYLILLYSMYIIPLLLIHIQKFNFLDNRQFLYCVFTLKPSTYYAKHLLLLYFHIACVITHCKAYHLGFALPFFLPYMMEDRQSKCRSA